jgi:hypothetical protein
MEVLIFTRKETSSMKHREGPEPADEGDIQMEYTPLTNYTSKIEEQ